MAIVAVALAFSMPATGEARLQQAPGAPAAQTDASGDAKHPERPLLRAATPPALELTLDGVLSESAWSSAAEISNLITIEPEEGGTPVGRTVVKVLAVSHEIVIGVRCYDPDPSGIVSFSKARDAELDDEDHVLFVLDTFQDGRSGYVFAVNPSGTRFDGLVSAQGTDVNSNWDAVWEAITSTDKEGWSAEIRIPIKSLGFKPGLDSWGFNVERRVQRLQESSRWSGATQDYEIFQTSRAGVLTGLPNFDLGLGLSIRPAITAGGERPSADASTSGALDVSLDVTQKLGANLLGSLTANTDFAETEVDARQTNLTRFETFFPEKRAFFLEGADIFEFGLGLNKIMIPFFSRRIGLNEHGVAVPVNAGGKLHGRVGSTNMGALVVNTRNIDAEQGGAATMGVARVTQNILAESSVGVIATFGDQLGRSASWMTGADFNFQTSHFRGDKNFNVSAWGLFNDREDIDGDRKAYGFGVDYPNDRWSLNLSSARLGDGFDPSLGFVPRNGVHVWNGAVAFEPRPGWPLVRQLFHEVSLELVNDLDNRWESYEWQAKPFDWLFESGDQVEFNVRRLGDRPLEAFDVFESPDRIVEVEAGSFEWTRYAVQGRLADKRRLAGEVEWQRGAFYDGHLDSVAASFVVNQSFLRLELGAERNVGTLPGGEFTQNLFSGRVELKFSPDLQVSSFVQYDNESESMGSNTRLRWTFHPLGDLFVVYNHNLQRSLSERLSRTWNFESNALIVKMQYAWRP